MVVVLYTEIDGTANYFQDPLVRVKYELEGYGTSFVLYCIVFLFVQKIHIWRYSLQI
jgi:hypothetical protein